MNFLPAFSVWPFAVAGAICAAGPLIIHLLNRRRFRTVRWAAMDFLREALQRNRRIMQLRDLLLLLLRTAAVLLVGLALAQPFFAPSGETFDGTKPLHAVLVIDNSLSMAFQPTTGGEQEITLLTLAKQRAKEFVERLPQDSRVSVIPQCGAHAGYSPDAFTKEDAATAIDAIEIVDRSADIQHAVNEAKKACESGPKLAKRVVFIGDQQAANWRDIRGGESLADLPSLQVVEVAAGGASGGGGVSPENTWVSDFRLQDGVADVDTPTTFIAEVRHEGPGPRDDVQVTLSIDGVEIASKTVALDPGFGAREVSFEHVLSSYHPEPGKPVAVAAEVSLTPDRLPGDDRRHLVCHVVASLPVVFVDQYSDDEEDPVRKRLGETRHLRKLLAPVLSRTETPRQLVHIRHVKFDELEQAALEDARLVVVAGIADPSAKADLLREYVNQGGQLVIAAGGKYDPAINSGFDPAAWQAASWLDGAGILPAPLLAAPLGMTPDEAPDELKPFSLAFESLGGHHYFQLASVSEDQLRDLYAEPFFFKAIQADVSDEALAALRKAEVERLTEQANAAAAVPVAEQETREPRVATEPATPAQARWLLWSGDVAGRQPDLSTTDPAELSRRIEELADQTLPRVLARFDDPAQTPFLIERRIGNGVAMFVSTGTLSDWNTIPQTNAMLIFDRVFRSMIQSTLPQRNFAAAERLTLPLPPVAAADRELTLSLHRPGNAASEVLDTGFIGQDQLGFTIPQAFSRGLYRVAAYRADEAAAVPAEPTTTENGREKLWELPLSVNGMATESELVPLTRQEFDDRIAGATTTVSWIGPNEAISLAGAQIRGQDSWWWLALAVLAILLLEMTVLRSHAKKLQAEPAGR